MTIPPSDPPPATQVEVEIDDTPAPAPTREPRRNRFGYYAAGSAMAFATVFCLGVVQLFSSLNATATQSPEQEPAPTSDLTPTVQVEPADAPLPCQPYVRTFIHKMEDGTRPWAVECQDGSLMVCPNASSVAGGIDLGVCLPLLAPPDPSEDTPPE